MGAGHQRPSARSHGGDLVGVVERGEHRPGQEAVRDRVWRLLEREGAVPEGSYGKIPGFYGADMTAEKGAAQVGRRVGVRNKRPIDVVVCGSVAVNRSGARLGKGAGYSDLEVALLIEAGLVTDETVIVAPVHQLQVVDEKISETDHDFSIDLIITPDEVTECPGLRRPRVLVWKDLTPEKIEVIPVLAVQAIVRRAEQG